MRRLVEKRLARLVGHGGGKHEICAMVFNTVVMGTVGLYDISCVPPTLLSRLEEDVLQ